MLRELLEAYPLRGGRFDEMLAPSGTPRRHWDAFLRAFVARERGADIAETLALVEREVRENGVTYNVYADAKGVERPWELDPLPLLLPAEEWEGIEAGIAQRARLLNAVLADIYGAQSLLRAAPFRPRVVFGHRGFLCARRKASGRPAASTCSSTRPTSRARPTATGGS